MEHNNTNTSSANTSSKETKEQLVLRIKEWIKIDNEISKLKKEIKERNDKKKKLTEGLVNVMKTNEIDCFDINGGALVYKKSLVKKPINGKMLMDTLQKYFKNDSQEATELTKFILDNRQQELKETIRRKIDKTVDK
jgi:single-stranded DNA-specific DHH superfamily exonuclease